MATYRELLQEKERIEAELAAAREAEVAEVITQIRAKMDEYGLTVDDLLPRRRGRPKKDKGPAARPTVVKYRNPKTGTTWSGRGRAPGWIGKNPNRFLVA
ncbi:H-NS histone family protein [Bordetella genomosp. 9]|uniref:DNA-binding protein n=1 Tax=Bordetella genomosp. 9 TaxID=1416803 RepID=A0A1W6Z5T6_9BORD|nr:H-NS histone family protein [Bordetella genomosp. 9]ARP88469.1 DNA-binding protein [Bordetella genomosp. 9]